MALARLHAAARPDALGFGEITGTPGLPRDPYVQNTYVARLKFLAPATMEQQDELSLKARQQQQGATYCCHP